jgi:hypothetical protein
VIEWVFGTLRILDRHRCCRERRPAGVWACSLSSSAPRCSRLALPSPAAASRSADRRRARPGCSPNASDRYWRNSALILLRTVFGFPCVLVRSCLLFALDHAARHHRTAVLGSIRPARQATGFRRIAALIIRPPQLGEPCRSEDFLRLDAPDPRRQRLGRRRNHHGGKRRDQDKAWGHPGSLPPLRVICDSIADCAPSGVARAAS